MKIIFYSFVFCLLSVFVYAQRAVSYVSFFPPTNVAHNDVVLNQDAASFTFSDLTSYTNTGDYHARKGGLILGTEDGAKINIKKMTIMSSDSYQPYTINQFNVSNMIRVHANGVIQNITIGNESDCPSNDTCNYGRISADNLYWPLRAGYVDTNGVTISSSGRTTLKNLKVSRSDLETFDYFPPREVPSNNTITNTNTTALSASYILRWMDLRINGTEECRKYLVLLPASVTVSVPQGGTCRVPGN